MPPPGPTPEEIHRAGELHEIHGSVITVAKLLSQEIGRPVGKSAVHQWVTKYYAQKSYVELYDRAVLRRRFSAIYDFLGSVCYLEFSQSDGFQELHQIARNPNPKYGVTEFVRDMRGILADQRRMHGVDAPTRVSIEDERETPELSEELMELISKQEKANALRMRTAIEAAERREQEAS